MPKKPEPIEYEVILQLYGFNAYCIDRLIGIFGTTREEVVSHMIGEYVARNIMAGGLEESLGLSIKDAERKGYIPVKKEEPASTTRKRDKG